jgi:hypothetical protein
MLNLSNILADAYAFISRLIIIDKHGNKVYLVLTTEQLTILKALLEGDDTLVLKPRQIGSSTVVAAYLFWCIYTATEPVTVAILSHKLKSSKHLLKMFKTFYYNLPLPLQRPLSVINSTELRFEDTGAGVLAESAGGEGGLRSFTCSKLWLSEYAFAPDPEELLATATSALNNGQLVIESTANYFNDAHHQEVVKAQNGLASWNFLFFPWHEHEEYRLDIPAEVNLDLDNEEAEMIEQFDLDIQQIYWRKKKIEKIGFEKFSREYPLTIEEAYQQLGDSYFKRRDLQYVDMIMVPPDEQVVLADRKMDDKYAMGVDVAAGVGRDFSVIFILSKLTNQPVYIFRSNTITPVELAAKVQEVAGRYGNAKVLIEGNNMGGVVLNELRHLGYSHIWKDENDNDWQTTIKTKTEMFENLKKQISSGTLVQIDNITMAELRALTVNEKGNVIIPDNMASHGDSVVALCLACMCLNSLRLSNKTFLPDWIGSRKADTIRRNKGASVGNHRRYQ